MTSRLRAGLLGLALSLSLTPACASVTEPPAEDASVPRDTGVARDGAAGDTGPPADTGPRRDGGTTMRDASVTCPSGQHRCGGGCIVDQANDPANGCRLGCGEPCPTPSTGIASCTSGGTCDFACEPPFHREGDTCTCAATTCEALHYECGAPDDGCGMPLDCGTCLGGAVCLTGRCGCMPDPHEENDDNSVATMSGTLVDSENTTLSLTDFTIDHMGDVDWIRLRVVDGTDGGSPRIDVTLRNIPAGSDFDLAAWYVCDNGGTDTSCNTGQSDNMIGRGCSSVHPANAIETVELKTGCGFLADASGTLYIRVTAPTFNASCTPYALDLAVN